MLSIIKDLLFDAVKDKAKPYVQKLLQKKTLRELWSRYLGHAAIVFLIGITIYILWQRFTHMLKFLSFEHVTKDESTVVGYLLTVLSGFSLSVSIISLALIAVLSLIGIRSRRITWKFAGAALLVGAILLSGNIVLGSKQDQIEKMVRSSKISEALQLWNEARYSESIDIFYQIYADDPYADVADNAIGRIAGAYYNKKQYQESILTCAKLLHDYPSSDVRGETITTLHWGIYQIGRQMELEDAMNYIDSVKRQYPTPEASPIWLGIAPDVDELLWNQDPFFYVAGPVLPPEDQKKLKILVSRFPNDPYADYGLYLLGKYDVIINEYPYSRILDWAYYAKAKHAFETDNFLDAAAFYRDFYSTFPNSTWADDAAYKAGMAYSKLGDDTRFLQEMYLALSLPDQDMANQVRQKFVWFANGLPSDSIGQLISSSSDPTIKESLLYALGKELSVEHRYREARDVFASLCAAPILSDVAQHCNDNIEVLNFIIDHEDPTPNNLLAIARLLATSDSFFDNELLQKGYGKSIDGDWTKVLQRNNSFQAISWANTLIDRFPGDPLVSGAYCLVGDAYQELSSLGSNLPFEGVATHDGYDVYEALPYPKSHRYQYREDATAAYEKCIGLSIDPDQQASAYVQRAMTYMYPPWDFERARGYFLQFADACPRHPSANNALMWVARTYVRDALHAGQNDPAMKALLLEAHIAYERILRDYPDGHVGKEAQEELMYVEKLLSETSP